MTTYQILTLPGLAGSGSQHWQSIWEDQYPALITRVEQDNWDWPVKDEWVEKLQAYVSTLETPVLLAAHSLGCITVAHWALRYPSPMIKGALLVAPADVEHSKRLSFVEGFSPVPTQKLPFPSIVAASSNDPYAAPDRSARFAREWGSELVELGPKGHINAISGLGDWKEGKRLLQRLENSGPSDSIHNPLSLKYPYTQNSGGLHFNYCAK